MNGMAEYDDTLEPPDDACEECGASWHTTRNCPVRRQQAMIDKAESEKDRD